MKIRSGFVSNSSSCSFCIYGLDLDTSKVGRALVEACGDQDLLADGDMSLFSIGDSTTYLGRPYASIESEETGSQFQASVVNHIRKLCERYKVDYEDIASECRTYEESGYGG